MGGGGGQAGPAPHTQPARQGAAAEVATRPARDKPEGPRRRHKDPPRRPGPGSVLARTQPAARPGPPRTQSGPPRRHAGRGAGTRRCGQPAPPAPSGLARPRQGPRRALPAAPRGARPASPAHAARSPRPSLGHSPGRRVRSREGASTPPAAGRCRRARGRSLLGGGAGADAAPAQCGADARLQRCGDEVPKAGTPPPVSVPRGAAPPAPAAPGVGAGLDPPRSRPLRAQPDARRLREPPCQRRADPASTVGAPPSPRAPLRRACCALVLSGRRAQRLPARAKLQVQLPLKEGERKGAQVSASKFFLLRAIVKETACKSRVQIPTLPTALHPGGTTLGKEVPSPL